MSKKHITPVFTGSLIVSLILVLLGIIVPRGFQSWTQILREQVSTNFGWLYLLLVTSILALCVFFIMSPLGQIRLGQPHSRPEYSTVSWIAMMFSAGMGIGLVFYGAAEPLSHFAISTPGAPKESQTALADAFRFTFFSLGDTCLGSICIGCFGSSLFWISKAREIPLVCHFKASFR
ncbi:transporter BCCT family protein [Streptococcus agalactiae]|nr:transporter BCCT family protein [Streptococcus agalactiae]CQJ50603.1 transporter BCCT family protein [Streptococcus agalactiae]SQA17040.1 Glycine betaine transporter OpuD [Streptococcus agalactiae]